MSRDLCPLSLVPAGIMSKQLLLQEQVESMKSVMERFGNGS